MSAPTHEIGTGLGGWLGHIADSGRRDGRATTDGSSPEPAADHHLTILVVLA